jgi:hypothetical protein
MPLTTASSNAKEETEVTVVAKAAQPIAKAAQTTTVGSHLEAEGLRRLATRNDCSLARMKLESPADEVPLDPRSPLRQPRGVIMKQCEVIDVAYVRRT